VVEGGQVDELAGARLLQAAPHLVEAGDEQRLRGLEARSFRHGVGELAIGERRALAGLIVA
jgi:hypothetical protein